RLSPTHRAQARREHRRYLPRERAGPKAKDLSRGQVDNPCTKQRTCASTQASWGEVGDNRTFAAKRRSRPHAITGESKPSRRQTPTFAPASVRCEHLAKVRECAASTRARHP